MQNWILLFCFLFGLFTAELYNFIIKICFIVIYFVFFTLWVSYFIICLPERDWHWILTGRGPSPMLRTIISSVNVSKMSALTRKKKFVTRGETFYDFLKELGYQPSSHLQHEHFEYLFQDEETSGFVKKLMSTLKFENSLSSQEIERFKMLKGQNLLLYGYDLEEAVKRHQSVQELHNRHFAKQRDQSRGLMNEISVQQKELSRLKQFEASLLTLSTEETSERPKQANLLKVVHFLSNENNRDGDITQRLLSENMVQLEQTTMRLLRLQKDPGTAEQAHKRLGKRYICQIDAQRIVDKEEKLFQTVLEVLRIHAPNLMMKEAGYRVEGDPLHAENVRKIFAQFKEDFDRVKHCIVYEKTNQVCLEISLAERERCFKHFAACCKKASVHSYGNADLRSRTEELESREKNIRRHYSSFEVSCLDESMLKRLRDLIVLSVGTQFAALTDIKTHLKRKLVNFFSVIASVLKTQKVRITILRNLSKTESHLYGRLVSNFEENLFFNSKPKKLPRRAAITSSDLTFEGQILHFLLSHLGVSNPMDILCCSQKVCEVTNKISNDIDNLTWTKTQEKQSAFLTDFKHISKTVDILTQVKNRSWARMGDTTNISYKLPNEDVQSLQEQLQRLRLTSVSTVNEAKKERAANLKKMAALLLSSS